MGDQTAVGLRSSLSVTLPANMAQLDFQSFEFTNPNAGGTDVLQDFDFDSFLHQDGEGVDGFAFDASNFSLDGPEIGAE